MIRVCMICKQIFGEKKPFEDKRETTGICLPCWPAEKAKLEALIEQKRKERNLLNPGPQSQESLKET